MKAKQMQVQSQKAVFNGNINFTNCYRLLSVPDLPDLVL